MRTNELAWAVTAGALPGHELGTGSAWLPARQRLCRGLVGAGAAPAAMLSPREKQQEGKSWVVAPCPRQPLGGRLACQWGELGGGIPSIPWFFCEFLKARVETGLPAPCFGHAGLLAPPQGHGAGRRVGERTPALVSAGVLFPRTLLGASPVPPGHRDERVSWDAVLFGGTTRAPACQAWPWLAPEPRA